MTIKKKAPPKKKAVKKKTVTKKRTVKKKVVKKHAVKKKAPVRKKVPSTRKKSKAPPKSVKAKGARNKKPLPPYHINHQSWDRPAVVEEISERLATSSLGLAYICGNNDDLPGVSTVLGWFNIEAKAGGGPLLDMYARAKESQADFMADEIIDISDNHVREPLVIDGEPVVVNGKLIEVTTPAAVNHARLRVDSRKFIASKLKPRVYGDKLELSGNPDRPLSGLTDEQLALRRKQLEDKLAEHGAN